jgi:hypothetical protein
MPNHTRIHDIKRHHKCDTTVTCEKPKCEKKSRKPCKKQSCSSSSSSSCEPKKCEKKSRKPCKKQSCSSSSSSSSCEKKKKCEKRCKPPKVVYTACINGGTASLALTYTVTPTTFTCPTAIGQQITITYTITNTGTAAIKSPRFVYDSLTGVHKVGKCKLQPGQHDTFVVTHLITRCQCATTGNISFVANAYTLLNCGKLILVSQPMSIVIPQV